MFRSRIVLYGALSVLTVLCCSTALHAQISLSGSGTASSETGVSGDGSAAASPDGEADSAPLLSPPVATAFTEPPMQPDPSPATAAGTTSYDNGFVIQTADNRFKLKINGMAQVRYSLYSDEWAVIGDDGEPGTNFTFHSGFNIPSARIGLSGHIITDRLRYALTYDIARNRLIDASMDWTFIPDTLQLKAGYFKRPMSRRFITSATSNQFIQVPTGEVVWDVNPTTPNRGHTQLGNAYDIGLELSNDYTHAQGLEWALAIVNGETGAWGDFSPAIVGRVGYNNGIRGYSETDFEGGLLRFGAALSAYTEFDHDNNDSSSHHIGIDGILKWQGLSVSSAVILSNYARKGFWDNSELSHIGAFVGGGYLINGKLEPVARYGFVHDYRVDEDLQQEITAGLTLHFFKNHAFKWENNVTLYLDKELNGDASAMETHTDLQILSQLQFRF